MAVLAGVVRTLDALLTVSQGAAREADRRAYATASIAVIDIPLARGASDGAGRRT